MAYPGGKAGAGVYQAIINQIPPHDVYIEPFLGGGAVMLNKAPAPAASFGVDKSRSVISSFPRRPHVSLICGDGRRFLETHSFKGRVFVYCDPPYVRSSRRSARDLYEYEMTDDDHVSLLTVLQGLSCNVAISGYHSEIYMDMLADWRLVTFTAQTRRGPATEYLWMNYPEPVALHDYRYLGADYRDRERIKRKAERWADRFENLPEIERRGILSAILARQDLASSVLEVGSHHQKCRGSSIGGDGGA